MTTTAVLALLTPWASGLMLTVAIAAVLLLIGLAIWSSRDRAFESTDSVAEAYDRWTDDQLLERLWGDAPKEEIAEDALLDSIAILKGSGGK